MVDLIDKKILCKLDENCRKPISKIAKELRIGRSVADYRIRNLEKEGIIAKYICSVDLGKLGYKTYKIYLKLHNLKQSDEKKFVDEVCENSRVIHFIKTEGNYDYSVTFAVLSIKDLDEFLSNLKTHFKSIIKDYFLSVIVYSRIYKLEKLLLREKHKMPKSEKISAGDENIALDEIDKKIIRELSQNANISVVLLVKKTKLSIDIVKYRIKLLQHSIINSNRVMIDLNKLGYYHYVMMVRTNSTKYDEKRLIFWCLEKENIIFLTKRIGNFDFEINLAVRDIDELNQTIDKIKKEFTEIIESYNLILNNKLLKLNYVPFE